MSTSFITVAETGLFVRQSASVWSDGEREEFVDFIAANPRPATSFPIPEE